MRLVQRGDEPRGVSPADRRDRSAAEGLSLSSRSFSSRAPPARPMGISTQNSAAVPKISEAMVRAVVQPVLARRGLSSARRYQRRRQLQHPGPGGIAAKHASHHAAARGRTSPPGAGLAAGLGQPRRATRRGGAPARPWASSGPAGRDRPAAPATTAGWPAPASRVAAPGRPAAALQRGPVLQRPQPERAGDGQGVAALALGILRAEARRPAAQPQQALQLLIAAAMAMGQQPQLLLLPGMGPAAQLNRRAEGAPLAEAEQGLDATALGPGERAPPGRSAGAAPAPSWPGGPGPPPPGSGWRRGGRGRWGSGHRCWPDTAPPRRPRASRARGSSPPTEPKASRSTNSKRCSRSRHPASSFWAVRAVHAVGQGPPGGRDWLAAAAGDRDRRHWPTPRPLPPPRPERRLRMPQPAIRSSTRTGEVAPVSLPQATRLRQSSTPRSRLGRDSGRKNPGPSCRLTPPSR